MKNVVTALIKELRDLILHKILSYIMSFLMPMKAEYEAAIVKEQMDSYRAIIRLLMNYVNKGISTAGRLNAIINALNSRFKNVDYSDFNFELPTILDDVYYADILESKKKDKTPIINNC